MLKKLCEIKSFKRDSASTFVDRFEELVRLYHSFVDRQAITEDEKRDMLFEAL